jgi:hypothetical protein
LVEQKIPYFIYVVNLGIYLSEPAKSMYSRIVPYFLLLNLSILFQINGVALVLIKCLCPLESYCLLEVEKFEWVIWILKDEAKNPLQSPCTLD